jgi:hypothetical protein
MRYYCFFPNNVYMIGQTAEEWKNSVVVIPIHTKCGKQKWKIIVYLMCFIKYSTVVNEKLKHNQNSSYVLTEWNLKRQILC